MCTLDERPKFPVTHAEACGDKTCLPPEEVTAIWQFARDYDRFADKATLCVGGK